MPEPVLDVSQYHSSDAHVRNFLQRFNSRSESNAPVELGHRTATVCQQGSTAIALQAKLNWDPRHELFVRDKSENANALLNREWRDAWKA